MNFSTQIAKFLQTKFTFSIYFLYRQKKFDSLLKFKKKEMFVRLFYK